MNRIREAAHHSVARGCGFAGLAIGTVMIGLSYDPHLSLRSGAILVTLMAVVLKLFALRAPNRDPRHTETWLLLEPDDLPPMPASRRLVCRVLAETYASFSRWIFAGALALWAADLLLALAY